MDDHFERLQAMKEHIEELMAGEVERADKQKRERAEFDEKVAAIDKEVALASALAALKAAAPDVKHDRVRIQINGARNLVQKALSA